MKALSIKQPWASLIAHGIKDIENRTWKTNFRGRIFIHASAQQVKTSTILFPSNEVWQKEVPIELREKAFFGSNITSAIIGEVDIIDCVINHPSIWAEKTPFGLSEIYTQQKTIYNWVLANAVLYDKPILNVKGKLSFWEADLNVCNYCLEWCKNDSFDGFGCKECQKKYKKRIKI